MHLKLLLLSVPLQILLIYLIARIYQQFTLYIALLMLKYFFFWMKPLGNDQLHGCKFTVHIFCHEKMIYLWMSKCTVIHTHTVQTATLKFGQGSVLHASWQQVNCDTLSASLLCNWQQSEAGK